MGSRIPNRNPSLPPDDPRPGDGEPRRGDGACGPSDESGNEPLQGTSPREILKKLLDGDPLEIEARCRERIETRAYLIDVTRLHLRAVARVARAAIGWKRDTSLGEFVMERIDYSAQELIQEDRQEELSGIPCADADDVRFVFLAETLGIPKALARRACVAFNYLPERVRCAYFAVLVQGKTVNRYVAEGHGPPERVKADIEMALRTISDAIGRSLGGEEGPDG
jgi:hypothetical protein